METLAELRSGLAQLASDGFREILFRLTNTAHLEAIKGFNAERDPYGKAWKPRRDKRGTWRILDKTGRGINRLTARPINKGVRLSTVGYMKYHLYGTEYMPPRLWAPMSWEGGLGQEWGAAFTDTVVGLIRERVLGR